jgi:hypothetical protein
LLKKGLSPQATDGLRRQSSQKAELLAFVLFCRFFSFFTRAGIAASCRVWADLAFVTTRPRTSGMATAVSLNVQSAFLDGIDYVRRMLDDE